MDKDSKDKPANPEVRKQNQDIPNIPASSEKIHSEDKTKKEIRESSELHETGKTENEEENEK